MAFKFQRSFIKFCPVLTWNTKIKGFDDALLQNICINSISPLEWFNSLSVIFRNEIEKYFRSIKNFV